MAGFLRRTNPFSHKEAQKSQKQLLAFKAYDDQLEIDKLLQKSQSEVIRRLHAVVLRPATMNISTRTPDGHFAYCPVCGMDICIEPSQPPGDAPCPTCGSLIWFLTEFPDHAHERTRRVCNSWQVSSIGHVLSPQPQLISAGHGLVLSLIATIAALSLAAAALIEWFWQDRTLSEMVGWAGLFGLLLSGFDGSDRVLIKLVNASSSDVGRC